MTLNYILLQAAPQGGGFGSWGLMLGMIAIFYVFMILPQMRKRKKQNAFIQSIGTGDRIVTSSGIHGKITKLDETTAVIELEDKQKMKIERSAISMEMSEALNKGTKDTN